MKRRDDPILHAAAKLADGEQPSTPPDSLLDDDQGREFLNLQRIATVQNLFRGPERGLGSPSSSPVRWGHLEIREKLGEGSFGEVFRAYDPILRREVALKLRRFDAASTSAGSIEEARRLACLRHPHVLAVHGSDVHDGRVGLWTDLVIGTDYEALIEQQGPHDASATLALITPVCDALQAVHAAGLVHGDVKASNIMRDHEGRVTLMDFGAGRQLDASGRPVLAASPLSMAPELFEGAAASKASDAYALGVLLFRLLTGRYPLQAEDLETLRALHRGRPGALPWRKRRPGRSLERLVENLLAKGPDLRPSAEQTKEALAGIANEPLRRRRRLAVGAVMASCALGTLLAGLGYVRAERSNAKARAALEANGAVTEFVLGLFDLGDPNSGAGHTVSVDEILALGSERVAAELAGQPLIQAELYAVLGDLHRKQANFQQARALLDQAQQLLLAHQPEDLAKTGEVVAKRATLAYDQGNYELAEQLYGEALDHFSRAGDPEPHRARTLGDLSITVRARGRYAEAEQLARSALLLVDESLDTEVADALVNVAVPLYLQREYDEAEALYRRAIEIYEREYGPSHLRVAATLNRLGLVYKRRKLHVEAGALFTRSLEIYRRLAGAEHPQVAMLLVNLASSQYQRGDFDSGRRLLEEAAGLQRKVLGAHHPDLAITLNNLAHVHVLAGEPQLALPHQQEALDIWRSAHGPEHPYVMRAMANLGKMHFQLDEFDMAEEWTRRALEMMRIHVPDDPMVGDLEERLEQILIRKS